MNVEVYTDGSALHNPGPAGAAYIIHWYVQNENDLPEEKELIGSRGFRHSTSQRMEQTAAIDGLNEFIQQANKNGFGEKPSQLNLYSDSEYVCKAINNRWIDRWLQNNWMTAGYQGSQPKPVANKDLWEKLLASMNQIRRMGVNLVFNHVTGHSGVPLNERCDELARSAASDTQNHQIDEVYERSRQGR